MSGLTTLKAGPSSELWWCLGDGVGQAKMPKRRKVGSPSNEEQRDICAELKDFIVSENEKCVREIEKSNDRRIGALEESLSFAMDSITAVSQRQSSADSNILQLQRETADLRRRMQQLELSEDRAQQQNRLTSLVFSGPALQAKTRREEAAQLIRALVRQYLNHGLDSAQVRGMIRLPNGKILVDFTSAAPGSDRDILFRSKTKLRGSGLYISESLTPRRQAIFAELLQLKRRGVIFSVFTRAGNILACRSRDSAPIRIASPDAVSQLAGVAESRSSQGRAQRDGGGDPPAPALRRESQGSRRERESEPPGPSEEMEGVAHSPGDPSELATHRGALTGQRLGETMDDSSPEGPGRPGKRQQPRSSSLLECAREAVPRLVQLSPPLPMVEAATAGSAEVADQPGDGVGRSGALPVTVGAGGCSASPCRTAVAVHSADDSRESPLPATSGPASPRSTAPASGERGGQRRDEMTVRSPALASGESGRAGGLTEQRSAAGGAVGGVGGYRTNVRMPNVRMPKVRKQMFVSK